MKLEIDQYNRLKQATEASPVDESIPPSSAASLPAPLPAPQSGPPLWRPFEDKQVEECIENVRCEGNCEHNNCRQTQPVNSNEPKVICYDCKNEFTTKNEMMDHKRDSDHPSKKKCNEPDCQRPQCWYVHTPQNISNSPRENPRVQPRFTCTTCQNGFSDRNELMHHRKREHPSNIICKHFLANNCRRSANQGALCWYRHDHLPATAPAVVNTAPFSATSASASWNTNFPPIPTMSQSSMVGLQQQVMKMIQQQKVQQQQQQQQHQQQMNIMMSQMMNMNM